MNPIKQYQSGRSALIGSSVAIFFPGALAFGYPGVMGPVWQEMFTVGRAEIGYCIFFALSALGMFMFWVGKFQEILGTRVMAAAGVLLCSVSLLVAAFAVNIYMIYIWAYLSGIAGGLIYTPAMTVVQRWYPDHRGLVSGIVSMIFALSAAIMAPVFGSMLQAMGYAKMNWSMAAVVLVVGLVMAVFIAGPEASEDNDTQKARTGGRTAGAGSLTAGQASKTAVFWSVWSVWALQGAAGISMVVVSVQFGISRGFSLKESIVILTAFNVMSGLSRLITGFLSDIFGRTRIMLITFWAAGLAYWLIPASHSLVVISVLACLVGFAFGTLFAVSAPLLSEYFGLDHFGAILGLMFTAYGFVSGIIGPSFSGFLLDISGGNFKIVFFYLGGLCFISGYIISRVKTLPSGR